MASEKKKLGLEVAVAWQAPRLAHGQGPARGRPRTRATASRDAATVDVRHPTERLSGPALAAYRRELHALEREPEEARRIPAPKPPAASLSDEARRVVEVLDRWKAREAVHVPMAAAARAKAAAAARAEADPDLRALMQDLAEGLGELVGVTRPVEPLTRLCRDLRDAGLTLAQIADVLDATGLEPMGWTDEASGVPREALDRVWRRVR